VTTGSHCLTTVEAWAPARGGQATAHPGKNEGGHGPPWKYQPLSENFQTIGPWFVNKSIVVKKCRFVPDDLGLFSLTMTFKLVRTKDQTRLPCEFGANPFSGSRYIS